jgi:hypothetical protein
MADITEIGQAASEVQFQDEIGKLKNRQGEAVLEVNDDQEIFLATSGDAVKIKTFIDDDAFGVTATDTALATAESIKAYVDASSGGGSGDITPDSVVVDTSTLVANVSGYTDKVGIGTATPGAKLDVAGNATLGDTGDDIHTVNGGATLQRNAASYVLTGSIDPIASTTVTGVGTAFLTELVIGDRITVTGETRRVTAIASATSLTVDTAFSDNANDTSPDRLPAHLVSKDSSGNVELIITDESNVGIGVAGPASTLEVRGTTGERTLTTGAAVSPTQIDLSYDASNKATIGAGSSGELVLWADDCMTHIRSDDTCTYLQIQNFTTGYYGSSGTGLSIALNGDNAFIKNNQTNGKLQLHSGTSGGGNLAFEINSSGEVTVLGSDTPATDEVLSWDGSKAVWEPSAGGGALNSAPADETYSGTTATFTAGEALSRGEVVYFKAADSKMWKAVASAEATSRCVAMAAADIAADATGAFLLRGFLTDNGTFPAYTVAGVLYTPEDETATENVPEQTAPDTTGDFVQVIGWAVTANTIYFDPDSTIIEIA